MLTVEGAVKTEGSLVAAVALGVETVAGLRSPRLGSTRANCARAACWLPSQASRAARREGALAGRLRVDKGLRGPVAEDRAIAGVGPEVE